MLVKPVKRVKAASANIYKKGKALSRRSMGRGFKSNNENAEEAIMIGAFSETTETLTRMIPTMVAANAVGHVARATSPRRRRRVIKRKPPVRRIKKPRVRRKGGRRKSR